jgi:hypothetical protein
MPRAIAGLVISKGYAEKGRALHVEIDRKAYSSETLTITCLTTLAHESGTWISNPHVGSNSGDNFLAFVIEAIADNVRDSL